MGVQFLGLVRWVCLFWVLGFGFVGVIFVFGAVGCFSLDSVHLPNGWGSFVHLENTPRRACLLGLILGIGSLWLTGF